MSFDITLSGKLWLTDDIRAGSMLCRRRISTRNVAQNMGLLHSPI